MRMPALPNVRFTSANTSARETFFHSNLVGFDYNKDTDIAALKRMLRSVKAGLIPDYY